MRWLAMFVSAALVGGCSGPKLSREQMPPPPIQQPVVWIRGDVKNPVVLWNDQLTLAHAIVAADYKGFSDPHVIMIIRRGQSYKVNPRDLLRGVEDPALEPGDTIVIER
jgi:hypothetical protein